ncbi:MAG: Asp23/Gls24 family envelope stress response protein [Micrococcaceae bacterium]
MDTTAQSIEPSVTTVGTEIESPLKTALGRTTVNDNVVAKLAGLAARNVPGVHAMGTAARRMFDAVSNRIPGSQVNVAGGVSVEKGEVQAAIDLTIIVEYGSSVVTVAEQIRTDVIDSVESATGLEVIEVNVHVSDVRLPEEDDVETGEAKVLR